jgi:hypothetical protein
MIASMKSPSLPAFHPASLQVVSRKNALDGEATDKLQAILTLAFKIFLNLVTPKSAPFCFIMRSALFPHMGFCRGCEW